MSNADFNIPDSIPRPARREFVLYLPLYNGIESLEIGVPAYCTARASAWSSSAVVAIAAAEADERPSIIVTRTHIAPGAPTKQDSPPRTAVARPMRKSMTMRFQAGSLPMRSSRSRAAMTVGRCCIRAPGIAASRQPRR
mgnify:CR=1 FL=1